MSPDAPWGRFDDLVDGCASVFEHCDRQLVAYAPGQVVGVLEQAEAATREGWWAFGYVAYEAASGLDAGLPVAQPRDAQRRDAQPPDAQSTGEAVRPLAWFGLCRQPRAAVPLAAPSDEPRQYSAQPWTNTWSRAEYDTAFERVKSAIAAGDTYQCNLTTSLRAGFGGDPLALYTDLIHAQRGRYGAYLDLGGHVIASASPELFFEWAGDEIRTRPMKGTITRGRTSREDRQHRDALLADDKERAENIIVVDLLRNDLSRIASTGTVRVPALLTPERYETVWQLTSEVSARPRPGTNLVDVFRALFPCGSVTGAPKRSTMRLIRELEPQARGVYCGAIGVLAPAGAGYRARFSVAIRTIELDRRTGQCAYGVGSGITWSSAAATEYAELHAKTEILRRREAEFELLETMAYEPGRGVRNLAGHLARMADSAGYFGFVLDIDDARRAIDTALTEAGPSRVRLRLSRTGAVAVEVSAPPAPALRPVRLAVDPVPIDSNQPWFFHKTTRREQYTCRAARHPDADDVVLVNEHGQATETTVANLAARVGDRWLTPPLDAGCLPGVERSRLVANGTLTERSLSVPDLYEADELALISSLRGWRAATLTPPARPADAG